MKELFLVAIYLFAPVLCDLDQPGLKPEEGKSSIYTSIFESKKRKRWLPNEGKSAASF
jgi:hypothetical protein